MTFKEVSEGVDISEEEAKQYDRQIRLWGLDAQKRLRASSVLVCGMRGLGAEVVKNIVLAGIKSLTILDSETADKMNCGANFLVPKDKFGENRAKASMQRAKDLNPSVEVNVDTGELSSKSADFFQQFDVVCVIGAPLEQVLRVNEICRALGKKFFAGDTFGFYGFCFSDLLNHAYAEEVEVKQQTEGDTLAPAAAKVPKMDKDAKTLKKTRVFTPFKETLDIDWSAEDYIKRLKKLDHTFFIIQAALRFLDDAGRHPDHSKSETDADKLTGILNEILESGSVPAEMRKVPSDFHSSIYGEISPVCAIVGGILSQEIIKACSHKDPPFKNMFLYNGLASTGNVDYFGKEAN